MNSYHLAKLGFFVCRYRLTTIYIVENFSFAVDYVKNMVYVTYETRHVNNSYAYSLTRKLLDAELNANTISTREFCEFVHKVINENRNLLLV